MPLPEGVRDAIAHVIATERREWQRERALFEAEGRAAIAEMRAEYAALSAELRAKLAEVRDGRDGKDGVDGKDGERGPQGEQGPVGERGEPGPQGAPGERGAPGEPGKDGADGENGQDGAPGRDGTDGRDGERGPEGPAGPAGVLPVARAWTDEVHYAGDVVTHAGATWQAQRATGRAPPHADWLCLAGRGEDGEDGRTMLPRGPWSAEDAYHRLDVAVVNGSSFVALRDDPGECPGDGWRLLASAGAKGRPGERGPGGEKGDRGPPGPAITALDVDDEGRLTLRNADGSTVEGDLYPLLSKIAHR